MATGGAALTRSRYGPWALIAGGTDGIGAEFARQLAERGLDLVLVGRRKELLERTAKELRGRYAIETLTYSYNLSRRDEIEALIEETERLEIGLLVSNAALSVIGPFLDQSFATHERLLSLNCGTPLRLTYAFAHRMKAMGRGGIILLSSMAGFQGTALTAHYAASKAYLRVLAEGLWEELRPFGVDVIASCPGTVNTPTFLRDEPVNRRGASLPVMEPGPVVAQTLSTIGLTPVVVPGVVGRIAAFFMQRILPRKALIRITARTMHAMYPRAGTRDEESSYRESP